MRSERMIKDKEETSPDSDLALVIGFSVGFGVVMAIVPLIQSLKSRIMTGEDKETTVTSVTFLSTKQQLNHSSKAKDAVLTSTYLGKCVHRHWISRTLRVSISNTSPAIALGEINQTENSYNRFQTTEYEEPQRYQTTAGDAIGQSSNTLNHENSPEYMEAVSCSSENEPRAKTLLNWINTNKKDQCENQLDPGKLNDLYITPCM
uniref:Uncharacterized protein n=1 Tax=Magallana gigas TaxID=29159 RepID=K1R9E3_MAGGI